MGITVKARVLLELGAELISSDQIAIYELVKNSLDARATRIAVHVRVTLPRSEYLGIRQSLERSFQKKESLSRDTVRQMLEAGMEPTAARADRDAFLEKALSPSNGDYIQALDAAYRRCNWVEITDDGGGMSFEDLGGVYLTIGTTHRLDDRMRNSTHTVLGEKGIGRLSAVRLGDQLHVLTSKTGDKTLHELKIDWSTIKRNPHLNLDEFPAAPNVGPKKNKASDHGTIIRMSNLTSEWSIEKMESLAKTDFAKLVDPFLTSFSRPNVRLYFNGQSVDIPSFQTRQLAYAHARCSASFALDADGQPVLSGEGYHGKQSWAHMLDEFWLGAIRAAMTLRQNLSKIEPSEIALLHEAELAVEEARLPDYLSWLVSESLASGLLEDAGVRALGAQLPDLIGHSAFPGTVPPGSRLAEMHVRSVMRLDITDDLPETKSSPVQLGDLFARLNGDGTPKEFLLVVDQSCDLARPHTSQKTVVLCLRCVPQEISDVALAFYRTAYGSVDLVSMPFGEGQKYYLASWDPVNPTTPELAELSQRRGAIKRLARLKPVAALARQEDLTQRVGRIGQPVAPPSVTAYRAKLVLIGKDGFQKEFDATKEPWASVIIVQGRHMPKPDPVDGGAASRSKTKTTTTLSLTSDFGEWLSGKLDRAHLADAQASSQANVLKQHLTAGTVQRVSFESGDQIKASLGRSWRKASLKKPSAAIHCVFDKTIPKDLMDAMIVLLLTPYEQQL